MKRVLAVIAVCIAVPVLAVQVDMSDDEKAACEAEGGCVFATVAHIKSLLEQAYAAGLKRGKEKCSV